MLSITGKRQYSHAASDHTTPPRNAIYDRQNIDVAAQPAGLAERPQTQAPVGAIPQKQAPLGTTGQAQQPLK